MVATHPFPVCSPCALHSSLHAPPSLFAPMPLYGPDGDCLSASLALKTMVRELHRAGIEVRITGWKQGRRSFMSILAVDVFAVVHCHRQGGRPAMVVIWFPLSLVLLPLLYDALGCFCSRER